MTDTRKVGNAEIRLQDENGPLDRKFTNLQCIVTESHVMLIRM